MNTRLLNGLSLLALTLAWLGIGLSANSKTATSMSADQEYRCVDAHLEEARP